MRRSMGVTKEQEIAWLQAQIKGAWERIAMKRTQFERHLQWDIGHIHHMEQRIIDMGGTLEEKEDATAEG